MSSGISTCSATQANKKGPVPRRFGEEQVPIGMWRWGELNSRPMLCCQVFSGCSLRRFFSAPAISQTSSCQAQLYKSPLSAYNKNLEQWPSK